MKHCPRCNRIETDDTLVFCRVDGVRLISDSSSSLPSEEIETSILPHTTDAAISRGTGQQLPFLRNRPRARPRN